MYYCNSRYYDPETGRFINADDTATLLSSPSELTDKNLYSYCDNNPVMREDKDGEFWNTIIGAVSGALVGGVSAAIMGTDIKAGIVSGAISGGIAGAALDITIATGGTGLVALATVSAFSGVGSALGSYTNQRMNGIAHKNIDWGTVAIDGIWGAVSGALSFGVADIGGPTSKSIRKIFSQSTKKICNQLIEDFAVNTTISAGTYLNGTRMNSLRNRHAIDRRSRAAYGRAR